MDLKDLKVTIWYYLRFQIFEIHTSDKIVVPKIETWYYLSSQTREITALVGLVHVRFDVSVLVYFRVPLWCHHACMTRMFASTSHCLMSVIIKLQSWCAVHALLVPTKYDRGKMKIDQGLAPGAVVARLATASGANPNVTSVRKYFKLSSYINRLWLVKKLIMM